MSTAMTITREHLVQALTVWNQRYAADPSAFKTPEETTIRSPRDRAENSADYLLELLQEPLADSIILRPVSPYKQAKWPCYHDGADFAHSSQAYWYRMRSQRSSGWPLEALRYFLKLSMWDERGRLWQCARPAVMDDFGNLVEVTP